MRKSKLLEKIRAGRCARICGLGHYLPFFVRYAAHHGYDAIWLDLEHRAMEQREVQSLLALCHACDIDCMLRSPTLERTRLYRYFEDGATGLMMPLVADAAMVAAEAVVRMSSQEEGRRVLSEVSKVTLVEGRRPGASIRAGVILITITPEDGLAGRPSSDRIVAAAGVR